MKTTEAEVFPVPSRPSESDRLRVVLGDIEVFGAWIRGSDTKAGLLAAALGIIAANIFAVRLSASQPVRLLSKPVGDLVLLGLLLAALLVTFLFLGLTLYPRLRKEPSRENPFAFPQLCSFSAYCEMDYDQLARHAWEQKETVAAICRVKHRMFRRALFAGALTMLLFVTTWAVW
jgi:hypothetical protein